MCSQVNDQQNECRCWHKSGWNEIPKRGVIRSSNHRKRRKKQFALINKNSTTLEYSKTFNCHSIEAYLKSGHSTQSPLPRMIFLSLSIIILPIIMSCFPPQKIVLANCQLILDHPKSRTHRATPERNHPLMFSATWAPYFLPAEDRLLNGNDPVKDDHLGRSTSLHPWKLSEFYAPDENIANYSTLPTNQDKQNELLRRLSSTMLLGTLLRHPFPNNKSPFPPLPWPSTASDHRSPAHPNNFLYNSNDNRKRPNDGPRKSSANKQIRIRPVVGSRHESKEVRSAMMDVSTTNRSTTRETNNSNSEYNPLGGQDLFNSSSLNYLVDKLLSVKPFKQEIQLKRPLSRQKYPANITYDEPYRQRNHAPSRNLTNTEVTLDMLIKDEYDSRVKPMVQSLMDQQKLSSPTNHKDNGPRIDTITNIGPINHKIDELASGIDTTTTNEDDHTFKSFTRNPNFNVPTTTPMSSETVATVDPEDRNTLVSYEDTEDGEEADEDEDSTVQGEGDLDLDKILFTKDSNKINKSSINGTQEIKKTLQNVPPYQLSGSFDVHPVRIRPPKLNIPFPDPQATTARPITSSADPYHRFRSTTISSVGKYGEKNADASIRGSLVFSDGATEAERANRRRAQARTTSVKPIVDPSIRNFNPRRKNQDLAPTTISDRTLHNQDEKPGESFLLNQLFSTINPLADLDFKLKEQLNKKVSPSNNSSLIYKGYVGKDDYFISTTPKDWSRPIVSLRENAPHTKMYKFQDTTLPFTTPAPPTDPPSVPYNYFLNQPVTNAQSVPTMVIPTSDPPDITTQMPTTNDNIEHDKRKVALHQNEFSHTNQHPTQQVGNTIQNITSTPMNNTGGLNLDRKFSYQIPDKPPMNQSSVPVPTRTGESELNGKSKHESTSSSKLSNEFDQNWSPSKVVHNESAKPIQKRRQQSQSSDNASMNPPTPMLVPIVGPKTPTRTSNGSQNKVLGDNDSDTSEFTTTTPKPTPQQISEHDFGHEAGSIQKNFSHADHRSHSNKTKRVTIPPSDAGSELMGDTEGDHWASGSENGLGAKKKSPRPTLSVSTHKRPTPRPDRAEADTDYNDDNEDDSEESDELENYHKKKVKKEPSRDRIRGDDDPNVDDDRRITKQNKTLKKSSYGGIHEHAGSEILVTGLEKNLRYPNSRRRNQTLGFAGSRQPTRVIETILMDGSDGGGTMPSTQTSGSFGSTIVPNSNYFGDAPSESTTLDSPVSTLNAGVPNGSVNGKNIRHHTFTNEDPYQRSSNTVLSTVQQPTSTTSSPTIGPKLQTTTAQVTTKQQQEDTGGSTISTVQQPTKPASKTSNDRLAFILIGGSCALSVVCLVLAAMSMRCQDMCDDYRSLRNAERAASKLQKHRLKYTKNHQINRFNHGGRVSPDNGHSLIGDLNLQNSNSIESEMNHMRNSKCLNSKAIQFNSGPFSKNTNDGAELNVWNSAKCQLPVSAYINKEPVACRCGNCINHRWLCQDDMLSGGNKQQSWLQPYYYMQNQSRARPLFGVGSSVGTFFPRRLDDHNFLATGGQNDAQILIDNQPAHSCMIGDQRNLTRSKSILHTSKMSRLPDNLNTPCEVPNFNCNHPEHSHHICHNHHKYNMETSTSEESKLTPDESVHHCDSVKCSANQNSGLNNRLKLMQMRSNNHNHQTSVWKPESIRKSSQNHHHHHHHHNQPQMSSSEGSSIAQCTCSRDHQPLLAKVSSRHHHKTSHKREARLSSQQQAKRDKAMLIWSTNRDRLI